MARKMKDYKKKTCYFCKFNQTCERPDRCTFYHNLGCPDFAWHSIFKSWNYNKKK